MSSKLTVELDWAPPWATALRTLDLEPLTYPLNLSRWRSTAILPLIALVQVFFHLLSKVPNDTALPQGWSAVGRR